MNENRHPQTPLTPDEIRMIQMGRPNSAVKAYAKRSGADKKTAATIVNAWAEGKDVATSS